MNATSDRSDLREALELRRVVEVAQPVLDRPGTSTVVGRKRDAAQDACSPCAVAGSIRVLERGLELTPCLVPVRRAAVQDRNEVGLTLDQFAPEQLPEQLVIPVPLSPSVERDQEQVPAFDPLELPPRALLAEHGIAQ